LGGSVSYKKIRNIKVYNLLVIKRIPAFYAWEPALSALPYHLSLAASSYLPFFSAYTLSFTVFLQLYALLTSVSLPVG
jgi:hypothetical protein